MTTLEQEFYRTAIVLMKRTIMKEQCIEECFANEMPAVIRKKLSEGWFLKDCYYNRLLENEILVFEKTSF